MILLLLMFRVTGGAVLIEIRMITLKRVILNIIMIMRDNHLVYHLKGAFCDQIVQIMFNINDRLTEISDGRLTEFVLAD